MDCIVCYQDPIIASTWYPENPADAFCFKVKPNYFYISADGLANRIALRGKIGIQALSVDRNTELNSCVH